MKPWQAPLNKTTQQRGKGRGFKVLFGFQTPQHYLKSAIYLSNGHSNFIMQSKEE
jgi:hypothetical protein